MWCESGPERVGGSSSSGDEEDADRARKDEVTGVGRLNIHTCCSRLLVASEALGESHRGGACAGSWSVLRALGEGHAQVVVVELGVVGVEQRLDTLRRGGHLDVTHAPILTARPKDEKGRGGGEYRKETFINQRNQR